MNLLPQVRSLWHLIENTQMTSLNKTAWWVAMMLWCTASHAAQTGDSESVEFHGRFIFSAPCTVSNDKIINVQFSNVGVNKVDGVNYLQPIPFTVECNGASTGASVKLTVVGTASDFDFAAVKTNADGLSIRIQADGQPVTLNEPILTTLDRVPSLVLTAVPVKDPAKTLSAQMFTATATLMAEYQ